jgi:hypothetical protein
MPQIVQAVAWQNGEQQQQQQQQHTRAAGGDDVCRDVCQHDVQSFCAPAYPQVIFVCTCMYVYA